LSILPEYQGKGIGKAVLEQVKKMGIKLTAVTRKETLNFFLEIRVRSKEEDGIIMTLGWMDILLPSRTQGRIRGQGSKFNKLVF